MNGKDRIERGAAEEASGSPLTETEARASQRPASEGDQPNERRAEKRGGAEDMEADEQSRASAEGR